MNNKSIQKLTDEIAQMSWSIRILQTKLSNKKNELQTGMYGEGFKRFVGDKGRVTLGKRAKYNASLRKEFSHQKPEFIDYWVKKGVVKPNSTLNFKDDENISAGEYEGLRDYIVSAKSQYFISVYLKGVMLDSVLELERKAEETNENTQKRLLDENGNKRRGTYHKLDEGHKCYQVINDIEEYREIDESIFDLDPGVAQFSDDPIEELRARD